MKLKQKIALVTGASRGIGRAIAIELANQGAHVIINYKTDGQRALATLNQIEKNGGSGVLIKGDVSDYLFAKKLITDIVNDFGTIDILVNNAGIAKFGLFTELTEQDWDEVINTNLKGVFNCCHHAVQAMLPHKNGSIINISSIWGNVGASCEVFYSASKGGVNAFTRALGKELAPSGIRVNAIAPGVIDTDMNNCFTEEERDALAQEIPMMRFGNGQEIAKLVAFLASDDASYITAQVITIDGGFV
ncbi:SDR family oxidoreductase [Peptococcaceae bacterium 1198_IL3148]